MARSFEGGDRSEPDGFTPSPDDRDLFADTTATRNPPFAVEDDEDDEADDGDTAAMRTAPLSTRKAGAGAPADASTESLRDETTATFVERPHKRRRTPSSTSSTGSTGSEGEAREPASEPPISPRTTDGRGTSKPARPPRSGDARGRMGAPRIDQGFRLSEPFATGGMATIHLGVRDDDRRIYAIKRLHAEFAHDEYFAEMLLDEAAIAARIRHQNVVTMYGAGIVGNDLILVMEYVSGLTIADLIRTVHPRKLPPRMVTAILADALRGLHAAHETLDEHGRPLGIVHRDVSPPNVHLGADGVARILDFGVAKAAHRAQTTRIGELKGKLAYMAPEQLNGAQVDRRVDVRAAAVVLWEALTGAPLFHAENETATAARVLEGSSKPPSQMAKGVPPELDAIVLRGLALRPEDRFETALEMAEALDAVFADNTPPSHEIAAWLTAIAADTLCKQWNLRTILLDDVTKAAPRRPQGLRASVPVPHPSASIPNASTKIAPLSAAASLSAAAPLSVAGPLSATWKRRPENPEGGGLPSTSSSAPPAASKPGASSPWAWSDPSQRAWIAVVAIAFLVVVFLLLSLAAMMRGRRDGSTRAPDSQPTGFVEGAPLRARHRSPESERALAPRQSRSVRLSTMRVTSAESSNATTIRSLPRT